MRSVALAWALWLVAAAASAQEVPRAYASASEARVTFETDTQGAVLSIADGRGGWTPVGIAPGELTLPSGPLDLGLGYHDRAPVRVAIALDVPDGARLVAHYESRQLLRELGVGIVLGTVVGVLIGLAIGIGGLTSGASDVGVGGLVAAGAVGVAGGATGGALATLDDLATLDVL